MCGIVGALAFHPHSPLMGHKLLTQMRDSLLHRGPDDAGLYIQDPIALAQRRLSIIDLAGGSQPMPSPDEAIWALNNGEIYNYREIRTQLKSRGYTFRTDSDTEAIIHAYRAYGENFVDPLRGMFAAAVWDARQQTLILARDRVGKKPLYYAQLPEGLVFASEIKALLKYEGLPRSLNADALADYFVYQSIPDPLTIFQHIYKLPPGHLLIAKPDGTVRLKAYWQWNMAEAPATALSYEEATEQVRELLLEAVRLRLVSDVPLGAMLSGGVDSSAVVGMMARLARDRVKTFSIGFSQAAYDERPYAESVAAFCGTDHQSLLVEPERVGDILPRLARQYDEPFADSSALPTYYLCKMAREHVTVALSGDGGDEAFAGYERYHKLLNISRRVDWLPQALRYPVFEGLNRALPTGFIGQRTLRLVGLAPQARYQRMNALFEPETLPDLLARRGGQARLLIQDRMAGWSARGVPYLNQLQQADLEVYLSSTVLVKVDRASMLNSLEVRSPLLDHKLLEFTATLPPEWRLGKRILKDAVRGLIPQEILTRPKAGFAVPLEHWFQGSFGGFLREVLLDEQTRQRGYLQVPYVEKLIARAEGRGANLSLHLWALLMFELWCREYL